MPKWEKEYYDNGELMVYVNAGGTVVMYKTNNGMPTSHVISCTPETAREIAQALIKYANIGDKIKNG